MAQKELVYKVKVVNEAGQVVETLAADINTLNKSVKDLENELNNTELGSEQFKDLQKELKKSKGALDEAKNSGQSFSEQLASIPGPIGGVVQGIKGMGTAFKVLLANPVALFLTAIVTALTALYKAFASTREGSKQLAQATAALGAIMDVFRDVLVEVTKALIKVFSDPKKALEDFGNLLKENIVNRVEGMLELLPALGKAIKLALSGEFKEAGKVAADAVGKVTLGVENLTDKVEGAIQGIKNIASEAIDEAKKAASLTKELQNIEKAQKKLNERRAEQNKLIAEARQQLTDENLPIEQRREALEKVMAAEIALSKEEENIAQRRFNTIRALNALSDTSKEAAQAESDAYIALQQAQQTTAEKQKLLQRQRNSLSKEEAANIKAITDLERTLRNDSLQNEQDRLTKQLEVQRDADLESIELLKTTEEKKSELRLLAQQKYENGVIKLEEDFEKKRNEARQKELDAETKRIDALLQIEEFKYDTLEELAEADLSQTLDLMRQKTELLLQNEQLSNEERLLIQTQFTEAVSKLENEQFEARKELSEKTQKLAMDQAMAASSAMFLISRAAGEQTEIGKAAAFAQATINTYLAASNAFKEATKAGGPFSVPLGIAAAGAAIALGLKQVNEIMSVSTNIPQPTKRRMATGGIIQGQGTGTLDNIPVMLSSGESVINARSTAMFRPTLDLINQLGGGDRFQGGMVNNGVDMAQMELISGVRQKNSRPVQAYVVASQAQNQLSLERQVKNRSLV
jgi:hypothetical protein